MAKEYKLQDPGEGIHEAEIVELHISEGDSVNEGEPVMAIETDKAQVDIPAAFTGTIEKYNVKVGDLAEVGDVLFTYVEDSTEAAAPEPEKTRAREAEEEAQGEEPKKKDERAEAKKTRTAAPERKEPSRDGKSPVPAAPATRRIARELGVDLSEVEPSGPAGRVTREDVQRFAGEKEEPAAEERPARKGRKKEIPSLPDFEKWGEVERVPLRSIRRAIAKQMALAWSQIPHVTHQDVADITDLEKFRGEHKQQAESHDGKLTLTVLVMKAAVAALKEFPSFNASLDPETEEVVLKKYYHLGVAVDTEKGLMVPVVRDVDRKSLIELSSELANLSERARTAQISRDEMQGGTFTITNPGPLGGTAFTPIINYPECAILGLAQARLEPTVQGDLNDYEIRPRLRMPFCLAFDHRINDGAAAARFVTRIAEFLEDPDSLVLAV